MNGVLGHQVGPFPVAGWLGIGVAGVGVAYFATKRKGAASSAVQPYAVDQSAGTVAPELMGGSAGTATSETGDEPSWASVFDAYRAGANDAQANLAFLTAQTATTQPASWEVPTTPTQPGTTDPIAAVSVPLREPAPAVVTAAPAIAPNVTQAIQDVGGGAPIAQRTGVGGLRAFTTFDAASQKTLKTGGTVVGGDGRVFKMVVGADGTPHATSLGTYEQVV